MLTKEDIASGTTVEFQRLYQSQYLECTTSHRLSVSNGVKYVDRHLFNRGAGAVYFGRVVLMYSYPVKPLTM